MVAIDDISLETKVKTAAGDPDVYRDAPRARYFHNGGGRGNRRVLLRAVNRGAGPCFGRPPLPSDSSVVQKTADGVVSLCRRGENGISGTQPVVNNLYQVPMAIGMDSVTGLYYERNRNYSPSLGRWTSQDPLQYINGANTYQLVMGNPVMNVDPMRSETLTDGFEPPPPFPIPEGGVPGGGADVGDGASYNLPPQNTGGEAGAMRVWNTENRAHDLDRALRQFCPFALPPSTPWWSNISGPRLILGPDMPTNWFISGANSVA